MEGRKRQSDWLKRLIPVNCQRIDSAEFYGSG